uniref:Uncharacterized protein n=1 Tax=Gopherus agassizii TaxID=38772 RepID=A0A452GI07_9SAUR
MEISSPHLSPRQWESKLEPFPVDPAPRPQPVSTAPALPPEAGGFSPAPSCCRGCLDERSKQLTAGISSGLLQGPGATHSSWGCGGII